MKKLYLFLVSFLCAVSIIGVFNFIIDPFQHYRKASFYRPSFNHEQQRYLVPGMAKNYNYETAIIGTSMMENFVTTEVENILNYPTPIKLCISGASAYTLGLNLEIALKNKNLKNVIYGLDFYSFKGQVNELRVGIQELPMHLYNNDLLDDYKYIFSTYILMESVKSLGRHYIKPQNDPLLTYETAFQWQHLHNDKFGKEKVLASYKNSKSFVKESEKAKYEISKLKKSFKINLLDKIAIRDDVEFIIFFPPYSIVAYLDLYNSQLLDEFMDFKFFVVQELSKFRNVKIYDFSHDYITIQNLDNYRDLTHYHQTINTKILQNIKNNNFKINSEKDIRKDEFLNLLIRYKEEMQ